MYELVEIYCGVMCHGNEEWCKIWWGINLPFQNRHEEFEEFWPEGWKVSKICSLIGSFWRKYKKFWAKKVHKSYVWWHWRLRQNLNENWLQNAFKNDIRNWANFHRLKNSDFISKSKTVELNHNKSSKQLHLPDAERKLCFTMKINE